VSESSADQDLGSGGILLLPDLTDSGGAVRHLAVGAGKDGNLYVVSRDSLGKFSSSSNNIWQQLTGVFGGGIFSTPAYFNGTLYYGPVGAALTAFAVKNAQLSSAPSSITANTFTYPGTSATVLSGRMKTPPPRSCMPTTPAISATSSITVPRPPAAGINSVRGISSSRR
jgi:hypothetical protein